MKECQALDSTIRATIADSAHLLAGVAFDLSNISLENLRSQLGGPGTITAGTATNELQIGWLMGPAAVGGVWAEQAINRCADDGPTKAHAMLYHDAVVTAFFIGSSDELQNASLIRLSLYPPFAGTLLGLRIGDSTARLEAVLPADGAVPQPCGDGQYCASLNSAWSLAWKEDAGHIADMAVFNPHVTVIPR